MSGFYNQTYFLDDLNALCALCGHDPLLKQETDMLYELGFPSNSSTYPKQEILQAFYMLMYYREYLNPQKVLDKKIITHISQQNQFSPPLNLFKGGKAPSSPSIWGGVV